MAESPKTQAGWAAAELAAAGIDAGLEVANLPGVAGPLVAGAKALVGLGQAAFNANAARAGAEAERTLDALPRARVELARLRGDVDELQRRLTMAFRVLMEAGRNPDRELQLALGRFAARVLVEDLDAVLAFEVADSLSRMTAKDLIALRAGGRGVVAVHQALAATFPGIDYDAAERSVRRLQALGVVDGGLGAPSPIGEELLRVIAQPTAEA